MEKKKLLLNAKSVKALRLTDIQSSKQDEVAAGLSSSGSCWAGCDWTIATNG